MSPTFPEVTASKEPGVVHFMGGMPEGYVHIHGRHLVMYARRYQPAERVSEATQRLTMTPGRVAARAMCRLQFGLQSACV
jgi:hypothetical protein